MRSNVLFMSNCEIGSSASTMSHEPITEGITFIEAADVAEKIRRPDSSKYLMW